MSLLVPPSVVIPFASGATTDYITNPVPVDSQVGILNGAASYTDGFPPATMVDPETEGGIPPFGQDMNGVLLAITAHTAWVAAGGTYTFNADVVTLAVGYPVGAILRSASTVGLFFLNTLANNPNDPDSVATGWVPFSPLSSTTALETQAPTIGTHNNLAVLPTTGYLDIDTAAGDIVVTGFAGLTEGQTVTVTNTGANLLTLNALDGGSTAANQFRFPTGLSLVQNQSITVRKSTAIGKIIAR